MNTSKSLVVASRSGSSRPVALAVTFFAIGVAATALWLHFKPLGSSAGIALSEQNRARLSQLQAPATIRFYAMVPATDTALERYTDRVGQWLEAVTAASGGKVQVIRVASGGTNADAAVADGVQPFNLEKGEASFLGLAISSGEHKESIARLQPEWEAALQYDVVRAILRVDVPPAAAPLRPEIAQPSPETLRAIKRLVPDVASTSLADADRIFHQDFLKQCAEAGSEMEAKINAAQEKVTEAQKSGSAEELEAAKKNLAEIQLAQGDKLKAIAAQLQTELAVFRQMKSDATNSAK
ncbi:MAG TPA: Gldg family protein [Verrucomicrobiae bacterium]|nr:Gldg family protein [Verrucomicrobiae bacterium]